MVAVIERMSTYPQLSFPLKIQKLPAPRVGGGQDRAEQRTRRVAPAGRVPDDDQSERRTAVALSAQDTAAADGAGDAGHLYRVRPAAAHPAAARRDRRLGRHGVVRELRRADPRQARSATGGRHRVPDPDAEAGGADRHSRRPVRSRREPRGSACSFRAASRSSIATRKTFQTWSLPPELNGPHVQINQVSPDRSHVDGKVWLQDAGTYTVLRLDVASGKVRGVRAVQDSAAERLRRDSRLAEQRILPRARRAKTSAASTRRPARSRSSRRRRRARDRGAA